tara:strand:+ start:10903 stop:11475 length:573 start_codon:yes stop_codon:yes gene_type:complete
MNIRDEYLKRKANSSDINEHLETLYSYGNRCRNITELGSRYGDSTIALLYSNPKLLTSYDLFKSDFIDELKEDNFKFIKGDSLEIKIEETDLLFIDTLHRYFQLFNELGFHAKRVRKYILLHDTKTYGEEDEPLYAAHIPVKMSSKVINTKATGLKQAIKDFLETTKEGKNWKIKEIFTNNNGLTVLERQ